MAQSVIWSSAAFEDFEAVTAFIAKDSTHYAAAFASEVLEAARTLSQFQNRGCLVPEFGLADIRELFVRNYRLIYRLTEKEVQVLGFIHGSRDLTALWVSRPG
jgi:toxin ParE1/3/4